MSTAFNNAPQSTKLVVVAAAASVATAAILLGYQGSQRKQRTRNLKDDLKRSATAADIKAQAQAANSQSVSLAQATTTAPPHIDEKVEFDEELVLEQLARNIAFLGEEGVQKLRNSFVVVVGAGNHSSLRLYLIDLSYQTLYCSMT